MGPGDGLGDGEGGRRLYGVDFGAVFGLGGEFGLEDEGFGGGGVEIGRIGGGDSRAGGMGGLGKGGVEVGGIGAGLGVGIGSLGGFDGFVFERKLIKGKDGMALFRRMAGLAELGEFAMVSGDGAAVAFEFELDAVIGAAAVIEGFGGEGDFAVGVGGFADLFDAGGEEFGGGAAEAAVKPFAFDGFFDDLVFELAGGGEFGVVGGAEELEGVGVVGGEEDGGDLSEGAVFAGVLGDGAFAFGGGGSGGFFGVGAVGEGAAGGILGVVRRLGRGMVRQFAAGGTGVPGFRVARPRAGGGQMGGVAAAGAVGVRNHVDNPRVLSIALE